MRALLVAVAALACVACAGCGAARAPAPAPAPAMTVTTPLPASLEAELEAIRADPAGSVGYGEKAYAPYEPAVGHFLISYDDPAVTKRLLAEIQGGDRIYKLALLHVLGKRADPTVDAALRETLRDPQLTATSAYLLARAGFKGYPDRAVDVDADRAALRPRLDDDSTFEDPFYRRSFRTQDFVLGAYIRLTGPHRFTFADPALAGLIGLELPRFDDATRADLLEQARRIG